MLNCRMLVNLCLILFFISFTVYSKKSKILFLSDIHLDVLYNSKSTSKAVEGIFNCKNYKDFLTRQTDDFDLGRYHCNSPETLLRMTLAKIVSETPDPDMIILGGDLIAHNIPKLNITNTGDKSINLRIFKETMQSVVWRIREYFSENIPILPAFGNNDFVDHYNVPNEETKKEKFNFVKELFFPNNLIPNLNVDFTFTIGSGLYYSYRYDDNFTFFYLFSNYFSANNKSPTDQEAYLQLLWLDKELGKITTKKAVIVMHIPPFLFLSNQELSTQWKPQFAKLFERITYTYRHVIESIFTGHTHWAKISGREFKNQYKPLMKKEMLRNSDNVKFLGTVTFPSVTPIYENNPGFSFIFLEDSSIQNIEVVYADLKQTLDESGEYSLNKKIDLKTFFSIRYSFNTDFRIPAINSANLSDFIYNSLQKDQNMMRRYICFSSGNDEKNYDDISKLMIARGLADFDNNLKKFKCSMRILYSEEEQRCIESIG